MLLVVHGTQLVKGLLLYRLSIGSDPCADFKSQETDEIENLNQRHSIHRWPESRHVFLSSVFGCRSDFSLLNDRYPVDVELRIEYQSGPKQLYRLMK